jgi:predicted methyltransferase
MNEIILSHFQAKILLIARDNGKDTTRISLDLGLSTNEVLLDVQGVHLRSGERISWAEVQSIADSPSSCFVIENGEANAIQYYSEATDRLYSLYPTSSAPSMLVSGIPMHRIKNTDPHQDTLEKIRTIKPLVGRVLDTATGLGYTAIQAAKTAEHVTTIELDPVVLQVCKFNPWSQDLFNNPKITQLIGDSFDVVSEMDSGSFTRVIHDPPVISLAGDLYSGDFYCELYRVMRNQSQLFHYIGDPESKSGRNTTAGVIRRLEQAGFKQLRRAPRAYGVVAVK